MATFHFKLASPEMLVFSGAVDHVYPPGSEGEFDVFAGLAPLVSTLRPGMLTVYQGGEKHQIVAHGGFAEVSASGLAVFADMAMQLKDVDRAAFAAQILELEERTKQMEPGSQLDGAIAKLDHYRALQGHMAGTAMH